MQIRLTAPTDQIVGWSSIGAIESKYGKGYDHKSLFDQICLIYIK